MPESEHEKEIRRQQTELDRSIREEGATPIPDDPKPDNGPQSVFRQLPQPERQVSEPMPGVRVESGEGRDGLESTSTKDLLRELIQVARNIPQEIDNLLRQD